MSGLEQETVAGEDNVEDYQPLGQGRRGETALAAEPIVPERTALHVHCSIHTCTCTTCIYM